MFEKKVKIANNFLDYIPVRKVDWGRGKKAKVYLLKEKTKNKSMNKLIDLLNMNRHVKIYLDELGASAWLLIDGKRNVHEISEQMKVDFGEDLTQAQQRVIFFFVLLKKNKFIDFLH
jgi:hypothetical protein